MDLGGWNSDFDSSFLTCWDDAGETNSRVGESKERPGRNRSLSSSRSSPRDDPSMWDGTLNQWAQLPNFDYETATSEKSKSSEAESASNDGISHMAIGAASQQIQNGTSQGVSPRGPPSVTTSSGAQSVNAAQVSATTSVSSVQGVRDTASTMTERTNTPTDGARLHPLAIQSSATCPPHGNCSFPESNKPNPPMDQQIPASNQATTHTLPQHLHHSLYGMTSVLDTSSMTSLAASLQEHSVSHGLTPETTQHLSNLAANFMLAQGNNGAMATQQVHGHSPHLQPLPTQAAPPSQPQQAQQQPPAAQLQQQQQQDQTAAPVKGVVSSTTKPSNTRKKGAEDKQAKDATAQRQQQQRGTQSNSNRNNVPPFYLFDAPIELRANFMQNQRRLGIPVQEDCNSYHYGETVKGFHPQNLLDAKHPPLPAAAPPAPVQLVDARHGNPRQQMAGRVKNEREQKRAQKITELIEQLRLNMESGGWKVEMRSKFHTLSSCAEYVKHMIKTIKEKEENMQKLKEELEVKQKKIAEDKSVQESRSDPESVTSSLTSSTGGSHSHKADDQNNRKRKANNSGDDSASTSNKKHCDNNSGSNNVSSYGTCEDSSGDDRGSRSGSRSRGAFNDVSDITDSNRGSSSNSSGSGGSDDGPTVTRDAGEDEHQSAGSISSDAAVRSEKSSHIHSNRQHHTHKDVVFSGKKSLGPPKRKSDEFDSLHRSFELDYDEVFHKSNIPQIIASTSGKVVAWNEVFMKATGLRKSEMERMTIFSLVQPDKLSNFFQIVAAALKPEDEQSAAVGTQTETETDGATAMEVDQEGERNSAEENAEDSNHPTSVDNNAQIPMRGQDYTTITLPCIDFPGMKKRRENNEEKFDTKPLHVTVTLMDDDDPSKRCFHCVFTNCKGTNGALGLITPELLEALFTEPDFKKSKSHHRHHHHHHKSKRPRTREQDSRRDEERLDGNKIDKIIPIPSRKTVNNTTTTTPAKTEAQSSEGSQLPKEGSKPPQSQPSSTTITTITSETTSADQQMMDAEGAVSSSQTTATDDTPSGSNCT